MADLSQGIVKSDTKYLFFSRIPMPSIFVLYRVTNVFIFYNYYPFQPKRPGIIFIDSYSNLVSSAWVGSVDV